MRALTIFLLLFLINKTGLNSQVLQLPSYDVIAYGETINRAELLITNWQFKDAFEIYDSLNNSLRYETTYFAFNLRNRKECLPRPKGGGCYGCCKELV